MKPDKKLKKMSSGSWCRLQKDECINIFESKFKDFIHDIKHLNTDELIRLEISVDKDADMYCAYYYLEAYVDEEKRND